MRRSSVVFLLLALLIIACAGWALVSCAPCNGRAWVVAANFYVAPLSVRVGGEPRPVFAVDDLPPGDLSPLAELKTGGEWSVLYKTAGRDAWQRPPRGFEAALCRIEPGTVTALVADRKGFIRSLALGDDARPGARLSFLNATGAPLTKLEVCAPGEEAFPVYWAKNLQAGAATVFRSVVPGEYRFSAEPAAFGGAARARGIAPSVPVSCSDSSYRLFYCFARDGAIVLESRLLAFRENGRLKPVPH